MAIEVQNVKMGGVKATVNTAASENKFDTLGASYLSIFVVASAGDGTAFAEQPTITESGHRGPGHTPPSPAER